MALDEDIVGELVLSSEEEGSLSDSPCEEREEKAKSTAPNRVSKKRKTSTDSTKKGRFHTKKPKRSRNTK